MKEKLLVNKTGEDAITLLSC